MIVIKYFLPESLNGNSRQHLKKTNKISTCINNNRNEISERSDNNAISYNTCTIYVKYSLYVGLNVQGERGGGMITLHVLK